MNRYFPHEKLDVYAKSLAFVQLAAPQIDAWPATASVRDQLDRASESLITNLVNAVRLPRSLQGIYSLECSLGSVLECAACLDVAFVKRLLEESQLRGEKHILQAIAQMEVGLRRSWCPAVHEEAEPYGAETKVYFAHESLTVYQRALQLCQALEVSLLVDGITCPRYARRIDELMTSLALNIAEGNGRFSQLDHGKFLNVAGEAGIKLTAYLDLVAAARQIDVGPAKSLLREVMAMLAGLKGYLEGGSDK
jgi:four helix bundle protein